MKLLFELVSCYWISSAPARDVTTAEEAPREEEPIPLLVAPAGRGQKMTTEWKPSLCTISEEKSVAVVIAGKDDDENRTGRSGGSVKRTNGSRSSRSHNYDFGRSPSALVIPAFSPTPFLY